MTDITEADRIAGFMRATGGMANAAARWQERAAKGMSDDELADALANEIGAMGGFGSPGGLHVEYRSAGLRIWIHREIVNTHQTAPTFQGRATMEMARRVYGMPDPAIRQFSLF